jgi:hypothetical protein
MANEKSFDPDVRYRNLLVAISRQICQFVASSKEFHELGEAWAHGKGKDMSYAAGRLRGLLRRNKRALRYYFRTSDPEKIAEFEIFRDAT